ncbi:hypothetical protein H0A36_06255 [Endozoicomonas sp. SM1973]|uniref:Uncharacterized protein n=1 Tax=Spartinivicinus marinus TaxID=2994442 RepID=A0A853I4G6_9GAMM|nr:hypothetical protein [Spartinivicinus marinus]MCX4028273.1 hypothetical protein [Spartinivicinus marinus]NYZ65608.1 hypothetical protein [Spartinivicinus marinus]
MADTNAPEVTEAILDSNGEVFGFLTTDPKVIYVVPREWNIHNRKVFLEKIPNTSDYELYFILGPDFRKSAAKIAEIQARNPTIVFLPLPKQYSQAVLNIPDEVGTIQTSLTPDSVFNQSPLLYYKLRITKKQLSLFKVLTQNNAFITGLIEYKFPSRSEVFEAIASIKVDFRSSDLDIRDRNEDYHTEWMKYQLFNRHIRLDGVLDKKFYLGSGISVDITDSIFKGYMLEDKTVVKVSNRKVYLLSRNNIHNFKGEVFFRIPLLNSNVTAAMDISMDLYLDLNTLSIYVTKLYPNNIKFKDTNVGSFYIKLLRKFLQQKSVLDDLSKALTKEFQYRLLNQNLFI